MDEAPEVFHVGIKNPDDFRRAVLESSKQVIYSMQRFEKLSAIRSEKIKKTIEIKNNVAELTQLIKVLKKELPKTKLRASSRSGIPTKIEPLTVPVSTKPRYTKEANDLDKLELELQDVEKKLNRLT